MENKFGKYVVQQHENEHWIRYAIDCACHDNEHRISFDMDIDKKHGDVSLTFYKDLIVYDKECYPIKSYYDCKSPQEAVELIFDNLKYFIGRTWSRIKRATSILFTGYSKFEGDFYMNDLEHIDELIAALTYAREKMAKCHEDDKPSASECREGF
jgi:hypothetical protein